MLVFLLSHFLLVQLCSATGDLRKDSVSERRQHEPYDWMVNTGLTHLAPKLSSSLPSASLDPLSEALHGRILPSESAQGSDALIQKHSAPFLEFEPDLSSSPFWPVGHQRDGSMKPLLPEVSFAPLLDSTMPRNSAQRSQDHLQATNTKVSLDSPISGGLQRADTSMRDFARQKNQPFNAQNAHTGPKRPREVASFSVHDPEGRLSTFREKVCMKTYLKRQRKESLRRLSYLSVPFSLFLKPFVAVAGESSKHVQEDKHNSNLANRLQYSLYDIESDDMTLATDHTRDGASSSKKSREMGQRANADTIGDTLAKTYLQRAQQQIEPFQLPAREADILGGQQNKRLRRRYQTIENLLDSSTIWDAETMAKLLASLLETLQYAKQQKANKKH